MRLEAIEERRLIDILNCYDAESHSMGSQIQTAYTKSKQSRMVLPVLGLQGMGKSSLINAILGQNILPEGADETTCIPVEVRYGESVVAKVHFTDQRQDIVIHTRKEIEEYVDNNMNTGNRKQVSCIELFAPVEILKSGLTLVDLPGVGSMVHENGEIAKRYAKNVSAAIFMIPCVPTIRSADVIFIKSQMAAYSLVIFVQNCWDDEAPSDVKSSLDYNRIKLHQVAESIGVQFHDEDLYPVNVYRALHGALFGIDQEMQDSGLNNLTYRLNSVVANWEQTCNSVLIDRLVHAVEATKGIITETIQKLTMDHEQFKAAKEKKLAAFRKETDEQRDKVDEILNGASSFRKTIKREVTRIATEHVEKIRTHMHDLINKGLTDGDKLTSAFRQTQEQEINGPGGAAEKVFDLMQEQLMNIHEQIEEFGEAIENERRINVNTQSFYHKIAFKFEGGWSLLGGIGGVIGAGATMGAIAGPAGVVVGIVVSIAASLVGMLAGRVERKIHADKTKKELDPYFDKIKTSIIDAAVEQASEVSDEIKKMMQDYLDEREAEENRIVSEINTKEPSDKLPQLEADLSYLEGVT